MLPIIWTAKKSQDSRRDTNEHVVVVIVRLENCKEMNCYRTDPIYDGGQNPQWTEENLRDVGKSC